MLCCCRLLVECNKLAIDIDNEVVVVHNFIRDKYRLKFPELESLVSHLHSSNCNSVIGNRINAHVSRALATLLLLHSLSNTPAIYAHTSILNPMVSCNYMVDLCCIMHMLYLLQVHHAVDYARVVKRIGNEMDLTLVDLDDLLPAATIMVVTVTATTTSGKPLTTDLLSKCMEGCDMVLSLEDDRQQVTHQCVWRDYLLR